MKSQIDMLIEAIAAEFLRRVPRSIDRQDLIQEGALAYLRALERYDETRGKLVTYVYRRIKGAMQDYVYREYRSQVINHAYATTPDTEPDSIETVHDKTLLAREIRQAYKSLSKRDRLIIKALYIDEVPQVELGKRLGICESAIHLARKRAVRHLVEILNS